MAEYRWATPVSGDWNTAALWSPAAVPNDPAASVTIDNPTLAPYLVTIAAGEVQTIGSLSMNDNFGRIGSNTAPYNAAILNVSGTLNFAPGSAGSIGGSLQSEIYMINGTIVNPGTVNAFVQGIGNVLITGTNGIYFTNWLQSLSGVVTVDTKSIAELNGNTLFDGIFEAQGAGAVVNLGGPRQNLIVNIQTIEGPPLIPEGWTELILNGNPSAIGQWNGTGYVGIESTLTNIASRGTLDVIGGRDYTSPNSLTIGAGGLLNLSAGTVTMPALNINGGAVQGTGTINSGVINNGTLRAEGGLLTVGSGGLVGTGIVTFDFDQKFGTIYPAGSTMEVHGVGPGQIFVMNGNDTLVLDTPASFAGSINAKVGDKVLLGGVTATTATIQGSQVVLQNGATTVASLNLNGDYTGKTFAVSPFGTGSTALTVTAGSAAPAIPVAPGAATTQAPLTLPAATNNFAVLNTTTGASSLENGNPYIGPVAGIQSEYVNITTDSLNVTANTPNVFIKTGSGTDALNVAGSNGTNVLDGGGGSNFLTGGSGKDQFYVDIRNPSGPVFSTVANFGSGDDLTIWGVSLSDFTVNLFDNAGAEGFKGLGFAFSKPGQPTANAVLAGYSTADLTNGRLSQVLGTTPDLPGLPGSAFLTIHANS
ncbi:MAG: hypothetical protein U1E70_19975 [Acetobacteraceae bacterium]|nr:hypothetical protein [Pseudomonadota bacterium]